MDKKKIRHVDERLGHVAIDMGLLNRDQVSEITMRVIMGTATPGAAVNFGQAAVEMGYLTVKDLESVELEERRRRRLITGYEIIDIIGAGNVATVYHASQLAMDREVALKILHPRLASDPVFVEAYIAEAQAVSRFHHPHIVQGFDAGESNGFYYFSHEYLSGGSMADRIRSGVDTFSETRLLTYLRQMTSALKHAWQVAVYHGDINPGNLLLDGEGNVKLANLGVPRVAGLKTSAGGVPIPGFVRCGPEYAAPEQLERPDEVNARTDIYSLGATFYHLSFGAPPFPGKTMEEILAFRKTNPVPSFSLKSQENFSAKYLRLLHDMLDPDPEKRPADPEALAARLEKFHVADAEDTNMLARQMRQASAPSSGGGQPALRRVFQGRAPRSSAGDRTFSLRMRRENLKGGRGMFWAAAAGTAALAAAAAAYFLM